MSKPGGVRDGCFLSALCHVCAAVGAPPVTRSEVVEAQLRAEVTTARCMGLSLEAARSYIGDARDGAWSAAHAHALFLPRGRAGRFTRERVGAAALVGQASPGCFVAVCKMERTSDAQQAMRLGQSFEEDPAMLRDTGEAVTKYQHAIGVNTSMKYFVDNNDRDIRGRLVLLPLCTLQLDATTGQPKPGTGPVRRFDRVYRVDMK